MSFDITQTPEHMWPRHRATTTLPERTAPGHDRHGWRCCGSTGHCRVLGPGNYRVERRGLFQWIRAFFTAPTDASGFPNMGGPK